MIWIDQLAVPIHQWTVLGFTKLASQAGEVKYLLIIAPMCFLWNTLWSVCRYIMGSFSGWWRLSGKRQQYLTAPVWKCMSGIGDHWLTFLIDLLRNYTFSRNLTIFLIGWLLIEDMASLITFNLWKVEKICSIAWCRIKYFLFPFPIDAISTLSKYRVKYTVRTIVSWPNSK